MWGLEFIERVLRRIGRRLREQGWRTTAIWLFGHGPAKLTGIPWARHSRVTPELCVGPQFWQAGQRRLASWGITGVVNLRREYDDAAHGLAFAAYCYLPTEDDEAPTLEQLETGVRFIQQQVERGGRVYIHCASGVGRAPTMAAAYLISRGHSLAQALQLIRRVRPFIWITPPQLAQLERFEALHAPAAAAPPKTAGGVGAG